MPDKRNHDGKEIFCRTREIMTDKKNYFTQEVRARKIMTDKRFGQEKLRITRGSDKGNYVEQEFRTREIMSDKRFGQEKL